MGKQVRIYIVTFRYGSRIFARAFSDKKRAELRALRIKRSLGILAEIIPAVLDGPDESVDLDFPRPDGAT